MSHTLQKIKTNKNMLWESTLSLRDVAIRMQLWPQIQDNGGGGCMCFCFIFISYDIVKQHHKSKNAVFPQYQHNCKCDTDFIQ